MIKLSTLNKEYYKTGEVAKMLQVTARTVQNYCIAGLMAEKIVNNRRYIPHDSLVAYPDSKGWLYHDDEDAKRDIIYARVSTHRQKERGDLDRQVSLIKDYVIYQNPRYLDVITDVASGLNDNRKGLNKLITAIQHGDVARVFVSHKDRLTRFGFNYLNMIAQHHGTEIIAVSDEVQDAKSLSEELAEDIIAIIHSFSGKLYGLRKHVRDSITKELSDD